MKQEEVERTIEQIKDVLMKGDYDSQQQKEKVQDLIAGLYYPATALEDQRYTVLGESLYVTTHLAVNKKGTKRTSLPMLKASKEGLIKFLCVVERLGILSRLLRDDIVVTKYFTEKQRTAIFQMADEVESESGAKRDILLEVLGTVLAKAMLEALADDSVNISVNSGVVTFIRGHTRQDGKIDYRSMGEYYYGLRKEGNGAGTSASLSIMNSMLSWAINPETPRKSQKARGIQAMTGDDYDRTSWLWQVKPSIFLSLEDATKANASELMATMRLAFGKVKDIFQTGLFVRTCPATPRPGALENIKAHTPTELLKAIRKLGRGMLDETQPDYDPEGCLCVMPFIQPSCSAVAVVGHNEIVMGGGFDDVTAGGGSNIVIPINYSLANTMKNEVRNMNLGDGMDAHEIEMVWYANAIGDKNATQQISSRATSTAGYDVESTPFITQVRGLHEAKESLSPPPLVDGEPLTVRGNVPDGSIEQQNFINVGQGDLSDCMELEQMAEGGELPEGLVVYCPSGSSNAHVAGVGIQWGIPVIYGIMPRENGTVWTEIDGWVTDKEGAEPAPYDPTALSDFFMIGCEDGDRFWDYGYHVLSQFFHTYLSGPRNDPRFEAYLGGFYTTWILKATLAVAMGEGRHAYQGNKAKFYPVHGLIHTYTAKALAGDESISWNKRNAYYQILKRKEIGLDNLCAMLKAYVRIYSEPSWPSGSYGGKNYKESVEKAVAVADCLQKLRAQVEFEFTTPAQMKEIFRTFLGAINTLENAVHNCSFFFNKFVANKKWFDIGTSHHQNTAKLEHQYHVLAALHYRFYRHHVDEPHMISKNVYNGEEDTGSVAFSWADHQWWPMREDFKNELAGVYHAISKVKKEGEIGGLYDIHPTVKVAVESFSGKHSPYCEDCDSYECGCDAPTATPLHYHGTCGLPNCPKAECQQQRLAKSIGVDREQFHKLEAFFNSSIAIYPTYPAFKTSFPKEEDLFAMEKAKVGALVTDGGNTVFTEPYRPQVGDDGKPYRVYTVPVENISFWTLWGRSTLQEWPEPLLFTSKYDTVLHVQPMIDTLFRIFANRFLEMSTKEIVRHYINLKQVKTHLPYKRGIQAYAGKHDLWDIYKLSCEFLDYFKDLGTELQERLGKSVALLTGGGMTTIHDWRQRGPEEFLIYFLRKECEKRLGGSLTGNLTAIIDTLETTLGREFVEEVIANGK